MGECGCGNDVGDRAVRLPNGVVIVFGVYRGCENCFDGPGYALFFFDTPTHANNAFPYLKQERLKPDEYGGHEGAGIGAGLFENCDLCAAAAELWKQGSIGEDMDQHETLADWLEDFGLELIRGAMSRFDARLKKRQEAKATP